MIAYHFIGRALFNGDPVPPDGEWLSVEGPLRIFGHGLHGNVHPADAARYARGRCTLCLCELDGEMVTEGVEICARRRRIISRRSASRLLYEDSRESALSVFHLWDAANTDNAAFLAYGAGFAAYDAALHASQALGISMDGWRERFKVKVDALMAGPETETSVLSGPPTFLLTQATPLIEILVALGLATSKGDARRLIQQRGVRLNEVTVQDVGCRVMPGDLPARVGVGKFRWGMVRVA